MKGYKARELSAGVARQRDLQHDLPGGLWAGRPLPGPSRGPPPF
jgi:hypothetical protein